LFILNSHLMKFYAVAAIGAAVSVFSARAQQDIPLSLETIGNSQRLVIYAGINGGAAEPYLFDTAPSGMPAPRTTTSTRKIPPART